MLRTGDTVLYYENGEERNGTIAFGGSAYHPEDVNYFVDTFDRDEQGAYKTVSLPKKELRHVIMVDVAPDDADLGEDENGIGVETEIFPASLVYELARDSEAELTHSKDELFQSINMEAFADDILHDAEEDAYDYFQDPPTHDDVIAFLQEVTDDFLEAYDYQLSYAEAVDPRREDVEKIQKMLPSGIDPMEAEEPLITHQFLEQNSFRTLPRHLDHFIRDMDSDAPRTIKLGGLHQRILDAIDTLQEIDDRVLVTAEIPDNEKEAATCGILTKPSPTMKSRANATDIEDYRLCKDILHKMEEALPGIPSPFFQGTPEERREAVQVIKDTIQENLLKFHGTVFKKPFQSMLKNIQKHENDRKVIPIH